MTPSDVTFMNWRRGVPISGAKHLCRAPGLFHQKRIQRDVKFLWSAERAIIRLSSSGSGYTIWRQNMSGSARPDTELASTGLNELQNSAGSIRHWQAKG